MLMRQAQGFWLLGLRVQLSSLGPQPPIKNHGRDQVARLLPFADARNIRPLSCNGSVLA